MPSRSAVTRNCSSTDTMEPSYSPLNSTWVSPEIKHLPHAKLFATPGIGNPGGGSTPSVIAYRMLPTGHRRHTMRAVWYDRQGPANEVIVTGELPTPEPGTGQVR